MIRIEPGDMLAVIPRLVAEGVICDAVVTDPPYHLIQMSRGGSPRQNDSTKPFGRAESRGGFMGQQWDAGDIAFRPETWATVATILRPGGFLVAFGGTRTQHRLTCAIEDAGFVIQDTLMWLFATGFPKRRDMLKPAFEPIVLAYKPGGKRTMQVDECRIAAETIRTVQTPSQNAGTIYGADQRTRVAFVNEIGRWPANICHDGSDEVVACFPESGGQRGDIRGTEPSCLVAHSNGIYGKKKTTPFNKRTGETTAEQRYTEAGASDFAMLPGTRRSDGGSAARFFFSAKAGAEDRWGSRHPTVKPVDLIAWLVALVTPPGGTFLDPFAGSGTAAVAALKTGRNAILIEQDAGYIADIRERVAFYEGGGQHSTQAKNRNRKVDHGPLFGGAA